MIDVVGEYDETEGAREADEVVAAGERQRGATRVAVRWDEVEQLGRRATRARCQVALEGGRVDAVHISGDRSDSQAMVGEDLGSEEVRGALHPDGVARGRQRAARHVEPVRHAVRRQEHRPLHVLVRVGRPQEGLKRG